MPASLSQLDTDYMFDNFEKFFEIYFSSDKKKHEQATALNQNQRGKYQKKTCELYDIIKSP